MTLTIAAARAALIQQFRDAQLETPELDARILIGHALSLDHTGLTADSTRLLTVAEQAAIKSLAQRRAAHEPVSRITGHREFWSLSFAVPPAVLVPRPDTETLVECALEWIDKAQRRDDPLRILDVGTGSGALLCALLSELPNASGIATDFSNDALATARSNALHLGFGARTKFVLCDFASEVRETFDLVVSNPPYIATAEIETLPPEVRDHDPRMALDGGADGLNAYRAIAVEAKRLLKPNALIVVELGIGQAKQVAEIFADAGLVVHTTRNDLAGLPRALAFRA